MTSLPPIEEPNPTSEPVPQISTEPPSPVTVPLWRFLVPLVLQAVLILAVPGQAVWTYLTGKTVILQTQPVDPYDFMRGYSQTLSYKISNPDNLDNLPGWQEVQQNNGSDRLFVILQAPATDPGGGIPKPWQPVAVAPTCPRNLPPNRVALKGKLIGNWQVQYGLETYYMPEDQRDKINQEIRLLQQHRSFVVEVKISDNGNAVPITLWVGATNYRF